jgi:predicted metalloprotease with PDZ domain
MIADLQQAPAHAWQSAEESSLDAWFEGNAFYRTPERSVSYYLKGDLLGMLLDLRLRQLTDGHKSLRDLFQWMNQHYAKRHYFFPDSAGVEEAAEAVAGTGAEGVASANQPFVRDFFRDYVAGVKAIPYNDFFQFVGLHLVEKSQNVATAGFTTTANIGGAPEVVAVDPDSEAQRNGLIKGDRLIAMNSQPLSGPLEDEVAQLHPGDTITLTVKNRAGQRDVKIRLGARTEQYYELEDLPNVTPLQVAHRTAWMHGDDEAAP